MNDPTPLMSMRGNPFTTLLFVATLFLSATLFADENLPAVERLKSCDPRIALTAAKEILNDPKTTKEPLEMFSPAFILFQNGEKDAAVFWFYAAQLRTRYQLAYQNGDRGQLLSVMLMTTGPSINNYAFQDVSNLDRILDRVLEWDKTTANPFREKPRSESIDKQVEQVYVGLRDLKVKLIAEKYDLEAKARTAAPDIERAYSPKDNSLCRKGQLDPAYAAQETKREWSLVIDFVKNDKEIIREAGEIKDIFPASSTKNPTDVMPYRYEVSVRGNSSKAIYPIIGVSRADGKAKFTLECISHLSMGYREAFKDACYQ